MGARPWTAGAARGLSLSTAEGLAEVAATIPAYALLAIVAPGQLTWWAWLALALAAVSGGAAGTVLWILVRLACRMTRRALHRRRFRRAAREQRRQDRKGGPPNPRDGQ